MRRLYPVLPAFLVFGLLLVPASLLSAPLFMTAGQGYIRSVVEPCDFSHSLVAGYARGPSLWLMGAWERYPEAGLSLSYLAKTQRWSHWASYASGTLQYLQEGVGSARVVGSGSCGFFYRTAAPHWWTMVQGGLGIQLAASWSSHYDSMLWDPTPYLGLDMVQAFGDTVFASLFVASAVGPEFHQVQLSFFSGGKVLARLNEHWMVALSPTIRFSDFWNESRYVTMAGLRFEIGWIDSDDREERWLEQLDIWP